MEITQGRKTSYLLLIALLFLGAKTTEAQNSTKGSIDNDNINQTILRKNIEEGARVISTGVPVLLISENRNTLLSFLC